MFQSFRRTFCACTFVVTAQLVTSLSAHAQPPCDGPEYRQFDFWLGNWEVHTPAGKLAGHNRIKVTHGGCVISEHYTTPSGYEGNSFSLYDAARQVWHQTWVDNGGTLLLLEGGITDNKMVMQGPGKQPDGTNILHRISWSVQDNGTVRQHWQTSTDTGTNWTTLFDGSYQKIPAKHPTSQ